jgi:hypothetical protein
MAIKVTKAEFVLILIVVTLVLSNFATYYYYNNQIRELNESYDKSFQEKYEIAESYQKFREDIFYEAENKRTAVTIVYYTNFGQNQQILSLSVPYEKYDSYHKTKHPYWSIKNLTSATEYISSNETIIKQIVEIIRNQTESDEELADALLTFVQDKGHSLSIRYYPTLELKYPIETLVEMGGDCDTKSFLYATLMKAAGFKVLLLYSNETLSDGQYHAATAIHLINVPEQSGLYFTYNDEKYYYAETTQFYRRVGELPANLQNVTFNIVPV